MLELTDLHRRYGDVVALDGMTFTVPAGKVFGFLGPNGAGKTTAMRAVVGVTALDTGSIDFAGAPVDAAARRRFGYMPEERGLYPGMEVLDQLEYLGRLHGMEASSAQTSGRELCERLGLEGRLDSKVEELSLGNQQRVQLAAALVHGPELLVLDEPFSGLDPVGIDDLSAVLSERAHGGATVLFSSHQLDLVEHLCEEVAIVDHGRLVAHGAVEELARGGRPHLAVRVAGDREGRWAGALRDGARMQSVDAGTPALLDNGDDTSKVGIVGGDSTAATATVRHAGKVLDEPVRPITFTDLGAARKKLRAGDLDALYVSGREVLVEQESAEGAGDDETRLASAIAQLARTPSSSAPARPRALPVHGLKAAPTSLSTRLTGLAVVVLIYLLVFIYGQRITSGVVEEKSSRVVEVLLASVRPAQLLTGKVLGMGITALAQVAALLATFLVVATATGSSLLDGAAVGVVLVGALWLILGYALHCTAFAAAGSLITRESDASNVTFPVALPLLFSYALSFGTIFSGSASGLFKILAYIPPTAPIASTTLYATGDAGIGQVLAAAAICIVATVATARIAATVYERSILRTGARVRVREALRGASTP